MWYFVYRSNQGSWCWTLFGADDAQIAESAKGYNDKQDCLRDIELVKHSQDVPVQEHLFDLKASF